MVENNTTKPPRKQRKDKQGNKTVPEDEAKLGAKLNKIRTRLIKPYLNLQTEEEKEEYKIQKPELDEVMAILAEIDKKNILYDTNSYVINEPVWYVDVISKKAKEKWPDAYISLAISDREGRLVYVQNDHGVVIEKF